MSDLLKIRDMKILGWDDDEAADFLGISIEELQKKQEEAERAFREGML